MKKNLISLLCLSFSLFASAQVRPTPHEWRATVKVTDETGQSVEGAKVSVGFSVASPEGTPISQTFFGQTDANGIFTATHTDGSVSLGFVAEKEGYYSFWITHELGFSVEKTNVNWNPTPILILKRIRKPIPMYAKFVNGVKFTNDSPAGFDFTTGDWVEPFGKGKNADIIFTEHLAKRGQDDYDYKLTVSFPNRGDGIQGFEFPYPTSQGSHLRSPHDAPEQGYEPQMVKTESVRPGDFVKNIWDAKTNYFFRVRTVLDEKGNVKSALYGKIYGDLNQFRYYLNPTPNDRNVEFDPKHNLMNLKSAESINMPP